MSCERFLDELEGVPLDGSRDAAPGELLAQISESARRHAAECAGCREALEDLQQARKSLAPMKAERPEPGPWFTMRVMQAITTRENELEERKNSVWISVRRLAPRLAALAAVVLVAGGTWALQLRRAEQQAVQPEMRSVEGLFEASPGAAVNDDIIASVGEERQP